MRSQNWKELFEGFARTNPATAAREFVGTYMDAVKDGKIDPMQDFNLREMHEALDNTAFANLTGEVLNSVMMKAYEGVPKIGDYLCQTIPSSLATDRIGGTTALDDIEDVEPGAEYPEIGMNEKYVTVTNIKSGGKISITDETIRFDRTGTILDRARKLGEKLAQYREKRILFGVIDKTGWKSYYPSGTQTDIYSSTHANLVTSNALADWTDIDATRKKMAAQTDESGEPILAVPQILLVPSALDMTARYIVSNSKDTRATYNADFPNMNLIVLSSPYLDIDSATTWYLGDFKRNFVWTSVYPVQYKAVAAGDSDPDAFDKDVVMKFKARVMGNIAATDYRFVVKSTG